MNDLARWLAKKQKRDVDGYDHIVVSAYPGERYSTLTQSDFSCTIFYTYNGNGENVWLDDREVVKLLNQVWADRPSR